MAVIVREKVKGSGEWWVFINHKGRRKSKKIGSKKAANNVARGIEERLAKGDMGMLRSDCPTVSEYGSDWLKSPLRGWSDGTVGEYVSIFANHIKDHFGSKTLNEIKRRHIKKFMSELNDLSTVRKRSILAVISGIMESALDDELIKFNPCKNTQKFCGKLTRKKISPLTVDEVQVMLENAAELEFLFYAFYFVAVRTGLRAGELLGLKWKDINFEKRHLTVRRLFYFRTKSYSPGKNKKSRRVDLTPATAELLKNLQARRKLVSLRGDDLVFTTNGEPLNYETVRKRFRGIAPRNDVRVHDLRHTYATLRISKNDNILDVSKQLGHHSVAFTLDQYAHWVPGEHKSQVDELDTLHLSAPYVHPKSEK